jgi:hypothetical protein
MTWLVWRQYRAQGAIAFVLLAAAAAVILVDGFQIASHWHSMLVTCSGHSACLQQQAPLVNGVVSDLPYLSLIAPAVLGMLWGAPLVAHELESRTSDFAWAQSVTRTRWLTIKAGCIAAGTVARRTLPAIAVALGGFIALRLVISDFLRPHYIAPVTTYYRVTGSFTPSGAAWLLSQGAVSKTGQVVRAGWGSLYPALPASCQRLLSAVPPAKSGSSMPAVFSCMQAHGWRGFATYQPASRYWPFQGIETGIYVLLAAALIAVTFVIVRRRDAS